MDVPQASPPGWFGKLPMLGDFAHRRLPPAMVQASDDWLSGCIAQSRQALGEDWLDRYLHAPLWCFAWAPRVVDDSWWFGVLMPSVDAVGRYFPLIVATRCSPLPSTGQALARLSEWYRNTGRCALATLQPAATLDGFELDLTGVASPIGDAGAHGALEPRSDGSGWQLDVDATKWIEDAGAIALRAVAVGLEGLTLWWPQGDTVRLTATRGMPAADRFVFMLQGDL